MRKLILMVHTSFDGFVSDLNGQLNDFIGDEELLGFGCSITEDADAALFGRINFIGMEDYWSIAGEKPRATSNEIRFSNWYKNATRIVVSKTIQPNAFNNKIVVCKNIPEDINVLKNQDGKYILMFGSPTTAHSLFEHNLIDEIWWYIQPFIFGEGIPLFKKGNKKVNLKRVGEKLFTNGVVALHYLVDKINNN